MTLFLDISTKKGKFFLIFLFFLAFAIRVCALMLMPQEAPDSAGYISLARGITSGQGFTFETQPPVPADVRAPLYPFFLAGVFYFCGETLLVVRIMQAFLDSVTCMFVFSIVMLLWNNSRIAFIGACIALFHPSLIGSTTFILSETLSTHLLTGSFFFLILALKRKNNGYFIAGGILMALNTLCRPVSLLFPAVLLVVSFPFMVRQKNIVPGLLIYITSFVLVLMPWTLRNYYHFGKFIPVSSNFGESLWAGSYQPWDGYYNPEIMRIRGETGVKVGYKGKGYYLIDDFLKKEALQRIKIEPLAYIRLCMVKMIRFWIRIPGDKLILVNRHLLRRTVYFLHYLLLGLFLYGIVILIRRECTLPFYILLSIIIYFTVIHAALMALPRYRIPVIPMVILFVSYGLFDLVRRLCADKTAKTSSASYTSI